MNENMPIGWTWLGEVAAALGEDWTASDAGRRSGTLRRDDGMELTAWEEYGRSGMVNLSGYDASIRVSPGREAEAVARDITRRLLPDAEVGYARHMEEAAQAKAYALGVARTTGALMAEGLRVSRVGGGEGRLGTYIHDGVSSDWRVTSEDSVTVQLRWLTLEQALQVARLIHEWGVR